MLSACWLPYHAQVDAKLEAEAAEYSECKLIDDSKYSGEKALELTADNARITFTFNATVSGKYSIFIGYDGLYGAKVVNVTVNGNVICIQGTTQQEELEAGTFLLNEGANTIEITPSWTWFRIDYIRIVDGSSSGVQFDVAQAPVDANASDAAKKLYSFLYDNFGKKTISGIMTGDMSSANGDVTQHDDVKAVYEASGKYPALVGFDFMNATGQSADNNAWFKQYTEAALELAKDTWRRGGLPAFTWHWRDPSRVTDAFYTADCSFKISDALNGDGSWNTESEIYQNIIRDIDHIADYFLALQSEGIGCIFRPLHECSGGWFWWGREGAEPYLKLYHLVFDEMVNVKGVHNIIWVWNAGENDADWNPGDSYYDVAALDIYNADFDYSSNYAAFDKLKTLTAGKKLIALSENGPIPDIDKEFEEEAIWSWWMPWYQTWNGQFVDKTSREEWTKCMGDDRVITLGDRTGGWNTTAIQNLKSNSPTRQAAYDLRGLRLTNMPSKGIYIQSGRKKLVR